MIPPVVNVNERHNASSAKNITFSLTVTLLQINIVDTLIKVHTTALSTQVEFYNPSFMTDHNEWGENVGYSTTQFSLVILVTWYFIFFQSWTLCHRNNTIYSNDCTSPVCLSDPDNEFYYIIFCIYMHFIFTCTSLYRDVQRNISEEV